MGVAVWTLAMGLSVFVGDSLPGEREFNVRTRTSDLENAGVSRRSSEVRDSSLEQSGRGYPWLARATGSLHPFGFALPGRTVDADRPMAVNHRTTVAD